MALIRSVNLPPEKSVLQQLLDHVAKCVTWPMEYPFKSEISRLLGLYQREENERLVAATVIPEQSRPQNQVRTQAEVGGPQIAASKARQSIARIDRELDNIIAGVPKVGETTAKNGGGNLESKPENVREEVMAQMAADLLNMRWVQTVTFTADKEDNITALHIRLYTGQTINLSVGG